MIENVEEANMSNKSQELNMRRLAALLSQDLSYIGGERECGPNGAKRTFLNVGENLPAGLGKGSLPA